MRKPWSLSTTVRNPERIYPFLSVLSEMEGQEFDEAGQIKYQTLLIQYRLYKPLGLSRELEKSYETTEDKMGYENAEEIFAHMMSRSTELAEDPGLRGRTSVAPLTKMGLAIAKKTAGRVVITSLGKSFLRSKDIGEVFLRFLLKWQIPNPGSNDFTLDHGYNIKPFLGILHLIKRVNDKDVESGKKPKGISRFEFSLFGPTLINYQNVDEYANKILELRSTVEGKSDSEKKEISNKYRRNFIKQFLGNTPESVVEGLISTLKDYGDNAIRYFRLTRYLFIRGGEYYIDLEKRRHVEIETLLSTDKAESKLFSSEEEYIKYLGDIHEPQLPWETVGGLREIVKDLTENIHTYEEENKRPHKEISSYGKLNEEELKTLIVNLREYRRQLQESEDHSAFQDVENVKINIENLKNIHHEEDPSVAMEKHVALSLHALNDALRVQPNYPVGDDNQPTFTAPAGMADIECFYSTFNAVCEVTMLTANTQWVNEGQPVMRHLRDFEDKYLDKPAYCLFIAPRLHVDTLETFLNSTIGRGYKGRKQKIVPLSLSNLIKILDILVVLKKENKQLRHTDLLSLFDLIIEDSERNGDPIVWAGNMSEIISSWGDRIGNS